VAEIEDRIVVAPPELLHWREGSANANGMTLAWQQAGPAQAEPLLLIMGLSRQSVNWPEGLCARLVAEGLRLIRFDNRDAGLSSEAKRGVRFDLRADMLRNRLGLSIRANYTLHDMVEDTRALMDALELRRVHLCGMSMGGMVAQLLAGKYPSRVLSLTTMMSGTNVPRYSTPRLKLGRYMFFKKPPDHSRATIIEHELGLHRLLAGRGYPTPDEEQRANIARDYDRAFRPGGTLRQTHAIMATGSIEEAVAEIRVPTQVIHGTDDPLIPLASARRTANLVRSANMETITGLGHDLPTALHEHFARLISTNIGRA
jgi:pimeloyl-ACP methyl ester carboxylesterase